MIYTNDEKINEKVLAKNKKSFVKNDNSTDIKQAPNIILDR